MFKKWIRMKNNYFCSILILNKNNAPYPPSLSGEVRCDFLFGDCVIKSLYYDADWAMSASYYKVLITPSSKSLLYIPLSDREGG